jgi:hypothetical protein
VFEIDAMHARVAAGDDQPADSDLAYDGRMDAAQYFAVDDASRVLPKASARAGRSRCPPLERSVAKALLAPAHQPR